MTYLRFSLAALGLALIMPTGAFAAADPGGDEAIVLPSFDVNASQDQGYRASNSVTGSRYAVPIKDLPFALQAFTSEFINDIHPETLYDVAMYSPGVSYRSTDFTNGNAELAIRGFNVAAGSLLYSAQSLRDGMKGPPIMDFANIDRVEIVKGPASFLYGQLAPGGMVNMITKTPKEKFQGTVTADVGSYGEYDGVVDLTGPITSGLYYRTVFSYRHDMNYWKPYDAKQWDIAPQVLYKLNDKAQLAVKVEKFEKHEAPQLFSKETYGYTRSGLPAWAANQANPPVANPVIPAGLPAWIVALGEDPDLSGVLIPGQPRNWNHLSNTDWRNSYDNSIEAILDIKADEHWAFRGEYGFDKNWITMAFSGRPIANPDINAYTAAYNTVIAAGGTPAQAAQAGFPYTGFAEPRRWRWQQTIRFSNSFEGQAIGAYEFAGITLKLLGGAQYNPYGARQKNGQMPDSTNPVYNPSGPLAPWDLRDPSTWNRNVPSSFSVGAAGYNGGGNSVTYVTDQAVYGSTTWGFLSDRLLVLAGIRRTWSSMQFENDYDNFDVPGQVIRKSDPVYKTGRNSPQVGALFKVLPDISAFASYSESFVPASGTLTTIDQSNPNLWVAKPGAPIQPTVGKGYDMGLKSDLLHGRISGTVTYYDLKNTNILTTIPQTGPNGIFYPTFQSGLQESKGVEADVTLTPIDPLQIYASADIMNARTVYVESPSEDARLLAVNTYTGYLALNAADQNAWKNVWRFHGKPLQMTSPHSYNVWTKYTFQDGPLKGLFLGGGANFVLRQTVYQDEDPRFYQTYTLLNLIAGYSTRIGRFPTTFTVNGKNLTNKDYFPSQNAAARPREFVFGVSTSF